MKILLVRLGLAAFLCAPAIAADPMNCPTAFHTDVHRAKDGNTWSFCVTDVRTCADGYVGFKNRSGNYTCMMTLDRGGHCPPGAQASVQGDKLLCRELASMRLDGSARPSRNDLQTYGEAAGDGPNQYRLVSVVYCPVGYHYGAPENRTHQIMCYGPDVVACGDGYAMVGMAEPPFSFCGSQDAVDQGAKCAGGKKPRRDRKGQWHCVEPGSDKCPKERRYSIGIPSDETQPRCRFFGT